MVLHGHIKFSSRPLKKSTPQKGDVQFLCSNFSSKKTQTASLSNFFGFSLKNRKMLEHGVCLAVHAYFGDVRPFRYHAARICVNFVVLFALDLNLLRFARQIVNLTCYGIYQKWCSSFRELFWSKNSAAWFLSQIFCISRLGLKCCNYNRKTTESINILVTSYFWIPQWWKSAKTMFIGSYPVFTR